MLSVGIDAYEREHYVGTRSEREVTIWRGRIRNNGKALSLSLRKFRAIKRCNIREVIVIFMNSTGINTPMWNTSLKRTVFRKNIHGGCKDDRAAWEGDEPWK